MRLTNITLAIFTHREKEELRRNFRCGEVKKFREKLQAEHPLM